jgi:hypothetical protein
LYSVGGLSSEQVSSLLATALRQGDAECLTEVIMIIGTQQQSVPRCFSDLQWHPAASQLTSREMEQILAAAVQHDNHQAMQQLC